MQFAFTLFFTVLICTKLQCSMSGPRKAERHLPSTVWLDQLSKPHPRNKFGNNQRI